MSETIEQAAAAAAKGPDAAVKDPPPPPPPPKRLFVACPCGKIPEKLILEMNQESKVARAVGGCCGSWAIEFLRGFETEPEAILDKAHAAWDAAPRAAVSAAT